MAYVSDHLELNTSVKFMQLSALSTNHSNYKSLYSKDTSQQADTFRLLESTKIQIDINFNDSIKIQDKAGFKKMNKRPIYQHKFQHNTKKTINIGSNLLQINKIANNEPKSNCKKDPSIQQLQARYVELDQELKKLKMKQKRTTNSCNRQSKRDNQYLTKVLLTIDDYSNKVTNQVESNQSKQGSTYLYNQSFCIQSNYRNSMEQKSQKNSHFFNKLKIKKLNEELEKIQQKNQKKQPRQIVQGCQINKNNHNNSRAAFRVPVTEMSKSKTAITRTGVQTTSKNSVQRKRPQSARQRLIQSKELKFKMQKIEEQQNLQLRATKIQTKKQQKFSNTLTNIRYSGPQINKTFRHISPIYKQNNWTPSKKVVQNQKIKQKMLNILIECESESSKKETIQDGIKVFEAYSKKMSKNLGKKSKQLQNIQITQMFKDNEADEAYH